MNFEYTVDINIDDAHSHTVAMVFSKARDNIIIADGVKTDVEKAVQYVSLKMMILKQKLIVKEDSSNLPNLKLMQTMEKSLQRFLRKIP